MMSFARSRIFSALLLSALLMLHACGGDNQEAAPASPAEDQAGTPGDAESADPTGAGDASISEESLNRSARIELQQYTVAYIGSGTVGGGTLFIDGESLPFRIAGLGYGGIGASAIDATGTVYNLPSIDAFPGTYGNARLGMTAGKSGGGKLWLRNADGVVIELESEMRGLALAGGADGILIEWDEGDDSTVDKVMDDSEKVVGEAIESGAEAVEEGIDKVKGWMKRE